MAIDLNLTYPGKTDPADGEYPFGKARNITAPGDGLGTPWEAAIVNDLVGFQQALLSAASLTPTNNPDKVGASQYFDSLIKLFPEVSKFGLGGLVPLLSDLGLIDNSVSTGLYSFADGSTSDLPSGITGNGFVMWTRRDAGGGESQFLISEVNSRAFLRTRITGAWDDWLEIYTARSFPATTSATDSTPGRFTKVGDFGLGGVTTFVPGNDLSVTDESISTGFYRFDSTTLDRPSGVVGNGSIVWMRRSSGGGESVMLVAEDDNDLYFKTRVTGAWSAWSKTFKNEDVVGTISNGAIIEQGSNSNGTFIKFADGTMICSSDGSRTTAGGGLDTWTFPAAFDTTPVVTLTSPTPGDATFNNACRVSGNATTVSIKNFFWNGTTFSAANNTYFATAVGRFM